eukprot:189139_1
MNKRNMILCTIFIFPILACYLIAAIVIAYRNTCTNEDDYAFIDPNLYLKIGGIGFLITSFLTTCTRFTVCQATHHEHYEHTTRGQACVLCIAVVLESIWAIVGCVVYSEISHECQVSSIGKMLLSFIIITFVFNCCNCSSMSQGCNERQHEYQRLPPV